MKPSRVRLAVRVAAIEAFREEGERQRLAIARRAASDADAATECAERTLLEVETARAEALTVRQDVARYLMWGDLAVQAGRQHERAAYAAKLANADADERSAAWAAVKARADATDDRAIRMERAEMDDVETRQAADRMDLWMNRRRRPA
jgi:hypothetical protein